MELAIVMLIAGIVIAGGATLFSEKDRSDKYDGVKAEMIDIDDGLAVFLSQNDRLPCPAPLTANKGDATYARETDCSDTTPPAGTFRIEHPASSGNYVRIGAAPIYDMEMPDEYVADAWYGKYLYAVSEGLTSTMTSSSTGNITVQDGASADIQTEVAWVVVSMGKDNMGAYAARTANMILNCASGTLDEENCDYSNGIFRDTTFNDGSVTANYFDDIIRWETVPQLYNIQLTVGGGGGGSSLPDTCTSGQIIEYNGTAWVCGTDNAGTTLPTCTADETIFFNGTNWICSPTCASGESLQFDGSNWVCAGGGGLPTCTADQIAQFDGTNWICVTPVEEQTTGGCTPGACNVYIHYNHDDDAHEFNVDISPAGGGASVYSRAWSSSNDYQSGYHTASLTSCTEYTWTLDQEQSWDALDGSSDYIGLSTSTSSGNTAARISWATGPKGTYPDINTTENFTLLEDCTVGTPAASETSYNISMLPTSCSDGQVLAWNGSSWECTDLGGGGGGGGINRCDYCIESGSQNVSSEGQTLTIPITSNYSLCDYTFTIRGGKGADYNRWGTTRTGGLGGSLTFTYEPTVFITEVILKRGRNQGVNSTNGGGASSVEINGVGMAVAGGGGGAGEDENGSGGYPSGTSYGGNWSSKANYSGNGEGGEGRCSGDRCGQNGSSATYPGQVVGGGAGNWNCTYSGDGGQGYGGGGGGGCTQGGRGGGGYISPEPEVTSSNIISSNGNTEASMTWSRPAGCP
jgi:hypothetical protein